MLLYIPLPTFINGTDETPRARKRTHDNPSSRFLDLEATVDDPDESEQEEEEEGDGTSAQI